MTMRSLPASIACVASLIARAVGSPPLNRVLASAMNSSSSSMTSRFSSVSDTKLARSSVPENVIYEIGLEETVNGNASAVYFFEPFGRLQGEIHRAGVEREDQPLGSLRVQLEREDGGVRRRTGLA